MKTARRHELKENDLAHYLEQAVEWTSANAKVIVLAVVGVAAVIGAWFYFRERSRQNEIAAWDLEYRAEISRDPQQMEQFAATHKKSTAGQLANLYLADKAFDEGVNQMSVDREAAEKRLLDAKNRYFEVREVTGDERIKQRAELGLARYFESMGDLEQAKSYYGGLAKIEDGLFKHEAERKLVELDRPTTIEFVEWYRKLQPKAQTAATGSLVQPKLNVVPEHPTGTAPTGTAPTGTAPTGTAPTGTAPTSTAPTSTAPAGTAPTGTATPAGTAPSGTAPAASAPAGSAPSSGTQGATTPSTSGGGASAAATPAGSVPASPTATGSPTTTAAPTATGK